MHESCCVHVDDFRVLFDVILVLIESFFGYQLLFPASQGLRLSSSIFSAYCGVRIKMGSISDRSISPGSLNGLVSLFFLSLFVSTLLLPLLK